MCIMGKGHFGALGLNITNIKKYDNGHAVESKQTAFQTDCIRLTNTSGDT